MGISFGKPSQTVATATSGTKDALLPRTKYGAFKRLRCLLLTCTDEGTVEVISCFGRHSKVVGPGCNPLFTCCGQTAVGRLSTTIQHQEVQCECRTQDGVFIEIVFSVQFRVAPGCEYEAFYSLREPSSQVTSYVLDAVGSAVAGMEVEEVFQHKPEIAAIVRRGLEGRMHEYGFEIKDCLITVLSPVSNVKDAMSNVLAARRNREAAYEQGEANKITLIKAAEGASESKYLQGTGVSWFLVALAAGARDSLKVLIRGRLSQEELSFPQPPPADPQQVLAAGGVEVTQPPSARLGHPARPQVQDGGKCDSKVVSVAVATRLAPTEVPDGLPHKVAPAAPHTPPPIATMTKAAADTAGSHGVHPFGR